MVRWTEGRAKWKVERIKKVIVNLIMVIGDAGQELIIVLQPLLLLSVLTAEHVRLKIQNEGKTSHQTGGHGECNVSTIMCSSFVSPFTFRTRHKTVS